MNLAVHTATVCTRVSVWVWALVVAVWVSLRLFNSVCLLLLPGSRGLLFITEIGFSSERKSHREL